MYTLLSIAKAHHASDLHITVGVRPKCRISGTLYEMDGFEKLTPAMTKELVESMFGPKQKATMEATGEVDLPIPIPVWGDSVSMHFTRGGRMLQFFVLWQVIFQHRKHSVFRKLCLD